MPHIIVTTGGRGDPVRGAVMLRERVSPADFDSDHFATQLVERIGWAVGDAEEVERDRHPITDPKSGSEQEPVTESDPDPIWAAHVGA